MKTRWESFVFILLMLLPGIWLLNTAIRPDAPAVTTSISVPSLSTNAKGHKDAQAVSGAHPAPVNALRGRTSKHFQQ